MATVNSIFVPDSTQDKTATIATVTSTAEIVFWNNAKIVLNATGDVNIRFGATGMGASSASFFRIPGGVVAEYDLGDHNDRIRLFNPGGSTITYWIQVIYDA